MSGNVPLRGEGAGLRSLLPLHASEMRTYLRCPREHQHAYVARRVPLERPEALARGTSVHRYLNGWWRGDAEIVLPEDPIARAMCLGYNARYSGPLEGLAHVSAVEHPFETTLGGVRCAGTVDVLAEDHENVVIIEHKTTASDISPGGVYWREFSKTNVQVSMYLAAYPRATIVVDALRKPAFSRLRKGKPNEETDDELALRCLAAMAEDPAKYFARYTIVRLESEREAFELDVGLVDERRRLRLQPRNADACHSFGRTCGYFDCCWEGASLDDDTVYGPNLHGLPVEDTES